jgi:WD40 repeat protein
VRRGDDVWHELGSLCNFLTPAGDRILTGGQLGRVFDAASGEMVHQHHSPLNCGATFMRDGVLHAVIGSYTGEAIVLKLADDGVTHVADVAMHDNAIKGIAVSDGIIFSVCADTSASWFDTAGLAPIAHVPEAHHKIANGCAPLPGGRFASVSRDLTLRLWNADRSVVEVPAPHDHSIKCVAADDQGRWVATASYYGTVAVYDVEHGAWLDMFRPTASGISSLWAANADGEFLASSYDGHVYPIAFPQP